MAEYVSHFVTAPDDLKLHIRAYGAASTGHLPVVCLPGLARHSADFHRLARVLSADPAAPRQVFAMDYRGRGQSNWDYNPANYNVGIEVMDLITVLKALGIGPALFIGTSRGGILTMLLAAVQPQSIAGAVLNDIGPVIETAGLARIKGYVGKLPPPADLHDAAEMLRRLFGAQFTALTADDWTAWAERNFEERDGRLVAAYDPALAHNLAAVDTSKPIPDLWVQFDALAGVPLMLIRGVNTDLLSSETVTAMRERRPDLHVMEVPGQGHAPLLTEDDIIGRIGQFAAVCDRPRAANPPSPERRSPRTT
jgi:pimeloyl-ACP methyl ester carboxylesterase